MPPSRDQPGDLLEVVVKSKHGSLEVSDARQLRQLEQDKTQLKMWLAVSLLDNAKVKEIRKKR